jgi:hypothetical protein
MNQFAIAASLLMSSAFACGGNIASVDGWCCKNSATTFIAPQLNGNECSCPGDVCIKVGKAYSTTGAGNMGIPTGAGNSYGIPTGNSYGIPTGNSYGIPTGNSYGIPAGNSYGSPAGNSYGSPTGNSYGSPTGNSYGSPTGNSYGSPAGRGNSYGSPAGRGNSYGSPTGAATGTCNPADNLSRGYRSLRSRQLYSKASKMYNKGCAKGYMCLRSAGMHTCQPAY